MPGSDIESSNTYIIDATSPVEMSRLIDQNRLMTQAIGGALSDLPPLAKDAHILDLACGPGGWVLNLAFEHPEMEVTGIDISEPMIRYAQAQADVLNRINAHFLVLDVTNPFPFPDASFDYVNLGCMSTFMVKETWPLLMDECIRILRPGGIFRMTDIERAISNSLAHERASTLLVQSLHRLGRSFSPDGYQICILPMMKTFLENAGFVEIQFKMFGVDYSFGTPAHDAWCPMLLASFRLAFPHLVRVVGTTWEELERVYEQASREMSMPEFRVILPGMTIWGIAPDERKKEK